MDEKVNLSAKRPRRHVSSKEVRLSHENQGCKVCKLDVAEEWSGKKKVRRLQS